SATQVQMSAATKKDAGTAMSAIATSCLIAASLLKPSRRPRSVFQNAAQMRAMPPRPGSAACARRCLYSVLFVWCSGFMQVLGSSCGQPAQHVFRHIEIGVDLLHVV